MPGGRGGGRRREEEGGGRHRLMPLKPPGLSAAALPQKRQSQVMSCVASLSESLKIGSGLRRAGGQASKEGAGTGEGKELEAGRGKRAGGGMGETSTRCPLRPPFSYILLVSAGQCDHRL